VYVAIWLVIGLWPDIMPLSIVTKFHDDRIKIMTHLWTLIAHLKSVIIFGQMLNSHIQSTHE